MEKLIIDSIIIYWFCRENKKKTILSSILGANVKVFIFYNNVYRGIFSLQN